MQNGVPILDTVTKPCRLVKVDDYKFKIVLTQGLNRQIRRMCEALDYRVRYLKRLRVMNIRLGLPLIPIWYPKAQSISHLSASLRKPSVIQSLRRSIPSVPAWKPYIRC